MHIKKPAKLITAFLAVSAAAAALCACRGPQYEEVDAVSVGEKGRAIMEEYLAANLPDARLVSSAAYLEVYPSGPVYLTGYAEGLYSLNDAEYRWIADVSTGKCYSSDGFEKLTPAVEAHLPELLGMKDSPVLIEHNASAAGIMLKNHRVDGYWFTETVLPLGTSDIDSYVLDPAGREPLCIRAGLILDDSVSIKELCSAEKLSAVELSAGINFAYGSILKNSSERLSYNNGKCEYKRYETADLGECLAKVQAEYIEEAIPFGESVPKRKELTLDFADCIEAVKTDNGYSIHLTKDFSDSYLPDFYICAKSGSEMLKHSYYLNHTGSDILREGRWVRTGDGLWMIDDPISADTALIIK